ncbi:outer membrane beta-barrel protein [Larkinella bovis]|uniref:Outer membrane beta-barrel protein n=1 Tax=Larkinella bovis TaxID=683041 RepID=A0ABW0ICH2_9BACT
MKYCWIAGLLVLVAVQIRAQGTLEGGVRGGGTLTHGHTILPAQTLSPGLEMPRIRNTSNGIGVGYLGGVWIRKNFDRFFLQAELSFSSLMLKQKASIDRIDILAASEFGVNLPLTIPPKTLYASLNATSDPRINSFYIPVFIGKKGPGDLWRLYGGPYLMITQQAEASRTASGRVEPNASIGFPGYTVTNIQDKVDLTNPDQAGMLQVKPLNFGVEFGAGMTFLKRLEVDLRYGLPVGGVFNERGITGFIGYATLAVGYKLISR